MPFLGRPDETRIRHSTFLRQSLLYQNQHPFLPKTYPKPLRDTITELPLAQTSILGSLLDLHPMFICSCIK
jgi:hypothetical protein